MTTDKIKSDVGLKRLKEDYLNILKFHTLRSQKILRNLKRKTHVF